MYLDRAYARFVLTLYRRHLRGCSYFGKNRHARGANACAARCPIWVQGTLRGESIRRSLNLRSWEAASDLIRGWDAAGTIGVVKPEVPSVKEAVQKFFLDAEARGLSRSTIGKLKNVLEKRLLPWAETHGCRLLKNLDVDALRRFRATWRESPITASKNLERLRSFFRFCVDSKWLPDNPARAIKPPKVIQSPTLPFEGDAWTKLLEACDRISLRGPYRDGNRTRMKAMLQLLRTAACGFAMRQHFSGIASTTGNCFFTRKRPERLSMSHCRRPRSRRSRASRG